MHPLHHCALVVVGLVVGTALAGQTPSITIPLVSTSRVVRHEAHQVAAFRFAARELSVSIIADMSAELSAAAGGGRVAASLWRVCGATACYNRRGDEVSGVNPFPTGKEGEWALHFSFGTAAREVVLKVAGEVGPTLAAMLSSGVQYIADSTDVRMVIMEVEVDIPITPVPHSSQGHRAWDTFLVTLGISLGEFVPQGNIFAHSLQQLLTPLAATVQLVYACPAVACSTEAGLRCPATPTLRANAGCVSFPAHLIAHRRSAPLGTNPPPSVVVMVAIYYETTAGADAELVARRIEDARVLSGFHITRADHDAQQSTLTPDRSSGGSDNTAAVVALSVSLAVLVVLVVVLAVVIFLKRRKYFVAAKEVTGSVSSKSGNVQMNDIEKAEVIAEVDHSECGDGKSHVEAGGAVYEPGMVVEVEVGGKWCSAVVDIPCDGGYKVTLADGSEHTILCDAMRCPPYGSSPPGMRKDYREEGLMEGVPTEATERATPAVTPPAVPLAP